MFKRKETQRLLEERTREAISPDKKKIETLKRENSELCEENQILYQEKKQLDTEREEQKELIERISQLAVGNTYGNAEVILRTIKELVRPLSN